MPSEARLDVLLYPELGMDPLTPQLAALRLAPVQVASWGHPETTGMPTIDHYLSAELFEAADSEEYYSERLVRLRILAVASTRATCNQKPWHCRVWAFAQMPRFLSALELPTNTHPSTTGRWPDRPTGGHCPVSVFSNALTAPPDNPGHRTDGKAFEARISIQRNT